MLRDIPGMDEVRIGEIAAEAWQAAGLSMTTYKAGFQPYFTKYAAYPLLSYTGTETVYMWVSIDSSMCYMYTPFIWHASWVLLQWYESQQLDHNYEVIYDGIFDLVKLAKISSGNVIVSLDLKKKRPKKKKKKNSCEIYDVFLQIQSDFLCSHV